MKVTPCAHCGSTTLGVHYYSEHPDEPEQIPGEQEHPSLTTEETHHTTSCTCVGGPHGGYTCPACR